MRLFALLLFPAVGLLLLTDSTAQAIEGHGESYPSPNLGTITLVSGRWSNNESFDNVGTLNNSDHGELINWSNRTLTNAGTLNNSDHGELTNYGVLNNHSTLTNAGTLNNGGELVDIDFSAANIKSGHNKFKNAADSLHYEGVASYGAGQAALAKGIPGVVGVSNTTDFLRAHRGGELRAEGVPVHVGRSQQLWEVRITAASGGALIARGQVRFQCLDRLPRGAPEALQPK